MKKQIESIMRDSRILSFKERLMSTQQKKEMLKKVYNGQWWSDTVDKMTPEHTQEVYERLKNSPKMQGE